MPTKKSKEDFINIANKIHNGKYDYSLVDYKNQKTKVKIICPEHGVFEMLPSNHTHKTKPQNCKKCSRLTKESFIKKSNIIHNDKYDYSLITEDISSTTKVKIICHIHGVFEIRANKHYSESKQGCKKCSQIGCPKLPDEIYIERLLNYKYKILSELIDLKSTKELEVVCEKHGIFSITVNHAIENRGCPTCAIENRKDNLTFSRKNFETVCNRNNNGLGIFYVIRCFSKDEEFYKFGITSRSIKERYKDHKNMPYEYEVIQEIIDIADNVYNIEKFYIKKLKEYRYTPKNYFPGSKVECVKFF